MMAKKWTKKAAIGRMKADATLANAIEQEPRIQEAIDAAMKQKNEPGYHRIHRYYELKAWILPLVGFRAENKTLRTRGHYDAVIRAIADLLPPDNVDLYPDGKEA